MSYLLNASSQGIYGPVDVCLPDPTKAGSVSIWYYPTYDPTTDTTNRMVLSYKVLSAGFNNWFRVMKSSGKKWSCGFQVNGVDSSNASTANVSLTQNAWNHICVTWGPGTATALYVNGSAVSLASSSHPSASFSGTGSTSMAWTLGSWYDSGGYGLHCSGNVAEFAMFGDTLTSAQAASLYAGRSPYALGATVRTYNRLRAFESLDLQTGVPGSVGTGGTWSFNTSGGGPAEALTHPTVDDPWASVITRTASAVKSRFLDRLVEWSKGVANSNVLVLDPASGSTNVPSLINGATYGVATSVTFGAPPLPGESRTSARFDGSASFIDVATETAFDFERTADFTIHAAIKIPQNLSNGTYAIVSKTLAGANATGYQFFVNKDGNGTRLVGRVGNTLTDSVELKTGDATVPTGRWTLVTMRVTGASTLTSFELFVDGQIKSTTASTIIGSADNSLAATILNNADLFIGKEVTASSGKYFNGDIAAVAVLGEKQSYSRILALGTLCMNDVPDIYVKDAQGNVHRPGDPGYKPNLIIDTDSDDDRGDAMAMELAAVYSDAGLCSIKAILVGQRKGHTDAGIVPAAVKKLRRLATSIGTWKGADIGATTNASTISAGASSIQTLYPSLTSGLASSVDSYPATLATFISAVQNLPNKSVIYCTMGHASVLSDILADGTAAALFASKVSCVISMFGDFSPSSDGTLFHSDNFDGAGSDGEFNIYLNDSGSGQPAIFNTMLAALTTAAIPIVVIGYNVGTRNGSTQTIPRSSRIMGLLTNSIGKAAADAQGATTDGRSPWDQFVVYLACHGPTRIANGGFEWGARGAISCNTATDTPYSGYGEGYSRLTPSPRSGSHWFLWFDDAADTTDISPVITAHMDRLITSAQDSSSTSTGGFVGDLPARKRTMIFE